MPHILVIDDETPIRHNVRRFLQMEGHRVTEAADGLAGLAAARAADRPDFIFCDVMMPLCNGFEVLAQLQADPVLREIPLVFLSASAENEQLDIALSQGACGYVTKPFNFQSVREALERFLKVP